MFEWLKEEIATIKTHKFHLVDGPATAELREAVESSDFPLPPSYTAFVLQFGNAHLYRRDSYYYVTICAGPREVESSEDETYIEIGRTWTSSVYFKESLLVEGEESPVFELYENGIRKTANGFEEWLKAKCAYARKRFKKKEWKAIETGPPPFTDQEQDIVEARKRFRWRLVGIAQNNDLQFEIYNGSTSTLPFLTVGIRHKNGQQIGGVWLPVSHIGTGQTAVVEKDCYKKWNDPHDVEPFEEPDPEPEDRDLYWEFRSLQ